MEKREILLSRKNQVTNHKDWNCRFFLNFHFFFSWSDWRHFFFLDYSYEINTRVKTYLIYSVHLIVLINYIRNGKYYKVSLGLVRVFCNIIFFEFYIFKQYCILGQTSSIGTTVLKKLLILLTCTIWIINRNIKSISSH